MAISEADLRKRWSQRQPCHGLWSLLPGAVTAEVLARTGADYVVVDLQHGSTAEADLPGTAAAITAAGAVPLVRTRSPSFADVGRPLDLGARGVVVPNVRDAAHARRRSSSLGIPHPLPPSPPPGDPAGAAAGRATAPIVTPGG